MRADSDGDGYWDGWIGVYGVGRSDDVILYREHLQSGPGVTGTEIVQEQIGYHPANAAPSGMSATIDGQEVHSNIHIGERQWGTDPDEWRSEPDPTVRIEVDYHADANASLRNSDWRESIEDNYALYGINVTFLPRSQTDVIDFQQSPYLTHSGILTGNKYVGRDEQRVDQPFTSDEIYAVRDAYSDSSAGTNGDGSLYMFVVRVANDSDSDLLNGSWGGVRWNGDDPVGKDRDDTEWISVFTKGVNNSTGRIPNRLSQHMSANEKIRAILHKTTVHEIGHVLNIGENEPLEQFNGTEVYSGCQSCNHPDPTLEWVNGRFQPINDWSVMSSGPNDDQYVEPTNATYFAFSIEELLTVSTEDTQVAGS